MNRRGTHFVILILGLCLASLPFSCHDNQNKVFVTIENTLDFDREKEMVEIPILQLQNYMFWKDEFGLEVVDSLGQIIPSQITYNGLLIFQPKISKNSSKSFTIKEGRMPRVKSRVKTQFHSTTSKDITWENNSLVFRFESKSSVGPFYGVDLLCKSPQVGNSFNDSIYNNADWKSNAVFNALIVNGSPLINSDYEHYNILENGPLRTTFMVKYPSLNVNGNEVSEVKKVSLDADNLFSRIEQIYQVEERLPMAIGITKRDLQHDSIFVDKSNRFVVYKEPIDSLKFSRYTSVILPFGIDSIQERFATESLSDKYLSVLIYTDAAITKTVIYYIGSGCGDSSLKNLQEYKNFVYEYSRALKQPFKVSFDSNGF